jgi:hypothetical protein
MKIRVELDNVEEFYQTCEHFNCQEGNRSMYNEITNKEEVDFRGLSKYDIHKYKYGCNKYLDELDKLDHDLFAGSSTTKYKWDENDGDEFDYERYTEGFPAIKKRIRTDGFNNGKFVKLHITISENGHISHKAMLYKALTAVKIVDLLEGMGKRVEIYVNSITGDIGYYKKEILSFVEVSIKFKNFNEPLNKPLLLNCISPWFFRYWGFLFLTGQFNTNFSIGHSVITDRVSNTENIYIQSGECLNELGVKNKLDELIQLFNPTK